MKKQKLNLGKLSFQKSKVASLESNSVTGGYQSWTGTYEPCFPTELGCGGATDNCQTNGCPPQTQNCPTNGCPQPTNYCGFTDNCQSHSVCPPGVHCY